MSLLESLADASVWEEFYEYKTSLAFGGQFAKELRSFIDNKAYLPVYEAICSGKAFPLPRKTIISKQFSQKKRTVYTYPEPQNTVLKLLTYLLTRKFDCCFATGLYSFRPHRTAKDAVKHFAALSRKAPLYAYKADISDYFNSIPVERLLPKLEGLFFDDPETYSFLKALLTEESVISLGKVITERKGIMAGTPLSAFYANLYLMELDRHFEDAGIPYARYSDDIIVFGRTDEEALEYSRNIRAYIGEAGLSINPKKETFFTPEEGWSFLGFDYKRGRLDVAASSVDKLKHKMRRKARALERWKHANGLEGEKAAKAFIRIFNRKLFESPGDDEFSWCAWYFPVLGTCESLKLLDAYAQELLRRLVTDRRTKARFNCRYEDLKKLGYRSLVHEYYAYKRSYSC